MRVLAIDFIEFRAMLGSGEERFCAKVLKAVPPLAERLNLVKEWKRAVTSLVLGEAGETLAARDPFDERSVTEADPGLSLAFASLLEGAAKPGMGGKFLGEVPEGLRWRPLFGLRSGTDQIAWGALDRDELATRMFHALCVPIKFSGLDVVGLTSPVWTDGKPG